MYGAGMRWNPWLSLLVALPGLALVSTTTAAPPAPSASTAASSPSLVAALDHLKKAKAKLEAAPDDAAGDRAQALVATDRAIVSVERALGLAPPAKSGSKGLDSSSIASTISAQKATLQKICFQPYSAAGSANVKLDLRIGPSGIVNDAVVLDQNGGDPRIGRCVVGQAWWWKFQPSGGDSQAIVPFVFVK